MFSGKLRVWLRRQHDQHKACVYETLAEYWKYHKGLNKKQVRQCLRNAMGFSSPADPPLHHATSSSKQPSHSVFGDGGSF